MKTARISYARLGAHFMLALVLASVLGSLVQTHLNLLAITQLIGAVSVADWLATCGFDLIHFAPLLALIYLPVLLVALVLLRFLPRRFLLPRNQHYRAFAFFLVPALLLYVALTAINWLAPMPTLIAANRDLLGTLLLMASLGLGGLWFSHLNQRARWGAALDEGGRGGDSEGNSQVNKREAP